MNPLDWAGVAAAITVLAVYAAARAVLAAARRWRLRDLADLTRDDVDPHWPDVRQTLGTPPGK